jgi:peptidoglycan hydrolase-like protein with peptidoglycan-binding domain
MTTTTDIPKRYLSCAETAKLVRAALKKAFPGVKFSVRSSTYAGGASIDVGWVDGPTTKEVDSIGKAFQGATFDGMIDLKSYLPNTLVANEDGTYEELSYGSDWVSAQRMYSEATLDAVKAKIAELSGAPFDGNKAYDDVAVSHFDGFDKPAELTLCSGHHPEYGYTMLHQYLYGRKLAPTKEKGVYA